MVTRNKESKLEPLSVVNCCHKSWFKRHEFFLLAGDCQAEAPALAEDNFNQAERDAARKDSHVSLTGRIDDSMFKLLKSLTTKPVETCRTCEEYKKLILDHLASAPTKFVQT